MFDDFIMCVCVCVFVCIYNPYVKEGLFPMGTIPVAKHDPTKCMHDEGGPSPCPLHIDVVSNLIIDTTQYYKESMIDANPLFIDCNNFMPNGLHNNRILTQTKHIPNMG